MLLHKDKNLFEQTIFQVVQRSGIESGIIERTIMFRSYSKN